MPNAFEEFAEYVLFDYIYGWTDTEYKHYLDALYKQSDYSLILFSYRKGK